MSANVESFNITFSGLRQDLKRLALVVCAGVLFFLAAVKIFTVVAFSPIMGYANNFDFIRQSSCIGLWQSYEGKPKTSDNPIAPVNSLVFDKEINNDGCMRSADNLFPKLATVFHAVGDRVDFREISFWKVFVLVSGACALLFVAGGLEVGLALGVSFFLVWGDVAHLMYANTMYFEFSVVLGVFFSGWAAMCFILEYNRKKRALVALACCSILWLGFSKQQYMPLASVFGLICAAALFFLWKSKGLSVAFVVLSLAVPIVYADRNNETNGYMKVVSLANKTDTFLWAVLPEAKDKEAALEVLALPKTCLGGIGMSWYTPGVSIDNHPCPDIERVSRAKLIRLFIAFPSTFFEPMRKAIYSLPPFYPGNLGRFENPSEERSAKFRLLQVTSLSYWLGKVPLDVFFAGVLISMFISPLLFVACFLKRCSQRYRLSFALIGLGGGVVFYSIFSSVFGDGYVEFQKHAVAFLIGLSFQITGGVHALMILSYRIVFSKCSWLASDRSAITAR